MTEQGRPASPAVEADKNKRQFASESLYRSLRKQIIELTLKPGESLSIHDLCAQYEVSRSPVRDALLRLSGEGLVDVLPQRGTLVSRIEIERVKEEHFLRYSLERQVLQQICEQVSDVLLVQLRENLDAQRLCLEAELSPAERQRRFIELDVAFHKLFFAEAQHPFCWELLNVNNGHYERVRNISLWDSAIVYKNYEQHERLMYCLAKKQLEALNGQLQQHLYRIVSELPGLMRMHPDYFTEKPQQAHGRAAV